MINLKLIYKIIGSLLFIEAALMAMCLIMAIAWGESDIKAFSISIAVTLVCALLLRYLGRKSDNMLSRRDAYLVVTLSWVLFSLFGTLPFMTGGYIKSFTDAYFETMSGFTTTGATIIDDVECLPHGILFWRSLTQWIGGLGIVFFTIALLPSLIGGSVKIFAAEATGPIRMKLHPKLSTSSQWIWRAPRRGLEAHGRRGDLHVLRHGLVRRRELFYVYNSHRRLLHTQRQRGFLP